MPLFIYVACLVLPESFNGSLACHANVQAFQCAIELRVGRPESPIFCEHLLR